MKGKKKKILTPGQLVKDLEYKYMHYAIVEDFSSFFFSFFFSSLLIQIFHHKKKKNANHNHNPKHKQKHKLACFFGFSLLIHIFY